MCGGGSNGVPSGLGRIIRDETGQVVAVETGDDIDSPLPTRERDLVEEAAAAAILSSECQSWVSLGHTSHCTQSRVFSQIKPLENYVEC